MFKDLIKFLVLTICLFLGSANQGFSSTLNPDDDYGVDYKRGDCMKDRDGCWALYNLFKDWDPSLPVPEFLEEIYDHIRDGYPNGLDSDSRRERDEFFQEIINFVNRNILRTGNLEKLEAFKNALTELEGELIDELKDLVCGDLPDAEKEACEDDIDSRTSDEDSKVVGACSDLPDGSVEKEKCQDTVNKINFLRRLRKKVKDQIDKVKRRNERRRRLRDGLGTNS